MIDKLLEELNSFKENENFSLVGYFPRVNITRGIGKNKTIVHTYEQGEIYLKYGFQHPNDLHVGYGVKHILSAHKNESIFSEIEKIEDISNILKICLRKNSKIFVENYNTEKILVISTFINKNLPVKVVLKWLEEEYIYSVITCYEISNKQQRDYQNQQSSGKIQKSA